MKTIRHLVSLLLLIASLGATRAQEVWFPRTSGIAAGTALWGVAYGNGQWVAVGELGTILTSPDGVTWTKRDSGFPDRWLVGVTNANGLWVVVGGTAPISESKGVLLTSTDGITWTPRITSATRINNVTYGNGTFVAVDDNGGRWTSLDGGSWSFGFTARSGNYLRGLAFGAPQFVATGLTGIQTSFDGLAWTNRVPTAGQLEGAAYGRKQFVVVGTNGATFTSRDGVTWQQQLNSSVITFRGAAFFNNQFIAVGNAQVAGHGLATSTDGVAWTDRPTTVEAGLILLAVAAGPDSAIAVGQNGLILQSPAAANPPSIARQPAAALEAVGGNAAFTVTANGTLPLSYQWRKEGLNLDGANSDTLFLPSVQVGHAGNYSCVVSNAFGITSTVDAALTVVDTFPPANPVDSSFTLGSSLSTSPRVAALQADGKIIIGGNFLLLNQGQAQFGLARLNDDGSLDTSFKPGAIDPLGSVTTVAIQADGKILVGGSFISINGAARNRLARLNADGSLDLTFNPAYTTPLAVLQLALTPAGRILIVNGTSVVTQLNPDGTPDPTWAFTGYVVVQNKDSFVNGNVLAVAVQPDSKIVAGLLGPAGASMVRLNADGTPDTTFTSVGLGNFTVFRALRVLADGRIMVAATGNFGATVQRVTSVGAFDSTFSLFSLPSSSLTCAAITGDGRTWLGGSFTSLNGISRSQLARLNIDGSLDATYNPGTGAASSVGNPIAPNFITPYDFDDGRALVGGDFVRINTTARAQLARLNNQSFGGANGPAIIALDSYYREVRAGDTLSVQVAATGSAQIIYSLLTPTGGFGGMTSGTVVFPPSTTQSTGVYSVTVTNSVGITATQFFFVRTIPSAPVIVAQPAALQTNTGRPVTLVVSAVGTNAGSFNYQWFKNGALLPNAIGSTYTVAKSTVADIGDYTVVVRNGLGFTTSRTVHVGVDETARIINLATRGNTTSSASPLILGFTIQGLGNKRVTIRAVGPTLEQFGVPGFLVDPVLKVYNGAGALIYSNDNWNQSNDVPGIASSQQRLGAFSLYDVSKDAAGILTLTPGSYTAVITGAPANGVETSGVALGEIYEDDQQSARLINLSSRGFVSPGASVMIPGFVTTTTATQALKKFLIRGIGPALQQFGVTNALLNPTLSVVDSAGKTVATNDDWEQNANVDELRAVTTQEAFPLAAGSKDAALLVSLPPGQYTCLVSGVANTSGTALVEIYEVP